MQSIKAFGSTLVISTCSPPAPAFFSKLEVNYSSYLDAVLIHLYTMLLKEIELIFTIFVLQKEK